jgi:UDP-sugar pyrophosphorylase
MVSDLTGPRTIALLEKNGYYGLDKSQVTIVEQAGVPAIKDIEGNLAICKYTFKVLTKPHGHGDVHSILHQYKVTEKWLA